MKITKVDLRTDLPPIVYSKCGAVNIVLAFLSDKNYDHTNTYIPRWMVSNTVYYNAHPDEFEGWVDLEDICSPFCD